MSIIITMTVKDNAGTEIAAHPENTDANKKNLFEITNYQDCTAVISQRQNANTAEAASNEVNFSAQLTTDYCAGINLITNDIRKSFKEVVITFSVEKGVVESKTTLTDVRFNNIANFVDSKAGTNQSSFSITGLKVNTTAGNTVSDIGGGE